MLKVVNEEDADVNDQSDWILMTRNLDFLAQPLMNNVSHGDFSADGKEVLWTDDYSSLMGVLY